MNRKSSKHTLLQASQCNFRKLIVHSCKEITDTLVLFTDKNHSNRI
jgi:hypothetical protein